MKKISTVLTLVLVFFFGNFMYSHAAVKTESNSSEESTSNAQVFISPNLKFNAVTESSSEEGTETYITNSRGERITDSFDGSFVSWSPDNDKVLLFLPEALTGDYRKIYYLSVDNKYTNSRLPDGVISADISPTGNIVFSKTTKGTDESTLYIKGKSGGTKSLLGGNNNIYTWVKWSPSGDKIAYLSSDLFFRPGNQKINILNTDGTGSNSISGVNWGYPPIWSLDGKHLLFAYGANVFEFNLESKVVTNKTNLDTGYATSPSYSEDGRSITFTEVKEGSKAQLTIENVEPVLVDISTTTATQSN